MHTVIFVRISPEVSGNREPWFVQDKLPTPQPQEQPAAAEQPPAKRPHYEVDEFDNLPPEEEQQEVSELQRYQQLVVRNSTPLLQWWKDHSSEFPGLVSVARSVLAVMATSAASERNFSLAGHVSAHRFTILPENVDNILFLNSFHHSGPSA
ncbi:hypothetical protein GJAV_G00115540 [Gymnothorax javanicus]|nr:hypothetical protein GJAV_G00115540 [Gymnothorax javanicus]